MTHAAPLLAIIGYGCRLPGSVEDGPSFWKLLCDGRDAVSEVPADRWHADVTFSAGAGIAGKSTSKWGGFLDRIDQFEPECFGISPREAVFIDPQQRLLLETTWEALEDAGLPLDKLAGSRAGVFIGISTGDYGRIQCAPSHFRDLSAFTAQGTSLSIAANRISYCFDLRGPSFIVDTACSSSLVALDRAVRSLREGECDLAIVGGVNVIISADTFVSFSTASMLSPEGRSKAFDASARGFVRAEGAGIAVVKRLADALAARDRIHAVVVESGVNQDGRTNGMAMPNGAAQEALLQEVYARADIRPEEVSYVEAHGTGTAIGDPTEAAALGRVFGPRNKRDMPLVIGSVKTNVGHLEAAAGMASLLKGVLMVQKRQIPPNLHFHTPNPNIAFDELGLRVPVTLESWPDPRPAIIGINSFGFGGTNAHAIIAEYRSDATPTCGPPCEAGREMPVVITARNGDALHVLVDSWLALLDDAERSNIALADIASAATQRRTHSPHVLAFAAAGLPEARELVQAFRTGESRTGMYCGERPRRSPPLVFAFSGQGPQWHAMGRELLERERVFREAIDRCDALLQPLTRWSLVDELRADEAASRMQQTSVAQPALFALQVALAELWKSWGVEPFAVVGHSVGELAAAHVAGALPLATAMELIVRRGGCLEQHALPGRMLAAAMTESDAAALVDAWQGRIAVSAVNSPQMLTLGGDVDAIDAVTAKLAQRGVWCKPLKVKHAFHTALVEPARESFLRGLVLERATSTCPMVSSVTGQATNEAALDAVYWWRNIREPVRFGDAIRELRKLGGDTFIEIGPHPVLSAAIRQCRAPGEKAPVVWPSLSRGSGERRTMLSSLTGLFASGTKIDWAGVVPASQASVDLPRHPWMRQRYWHECDDSRRARLPDDHHPLLGQRLPGADRRWQIVIDTAELTWLKDHRIGGRILFPAAAFVEMALAAATRCLGSNSCTIDDLCIGRVLALRDGATPTLQTCADPESYALQICSRSDDTDDAWLGHVEATFRPVSDDRNRDPLDVAAWQQAARGSRPGREVYESYRALDMEFGPAFQGIVEVSRRDGAALGRIQLPNPTSADNALIIHPALLDACFQVLLEAMPGRTRNADSMFLPERIDRIRYYQRPGSDAWSEVRVTSTSRIAVSGDIRIFCKSGEPALEITGFRCRAMPRVDRSRQPITECFYRTAWHHQPLSFATGQRPALEWSDSVGSLVRSADAAAAGVWHERTPTQTENGLAAGDRLALAYIVRALRDIASRTSPRGGAYIDPDALVASGTVLERFRPQIERCLDALIQANCARRLRKGRWRLTCAKPDYDVDKLWQEGLANHPDRYGPFRLVEICGAQLCAIWSGGVDPMTVLFSREGVDLLEQLYRDEAWTRYANAVTAQVVARLVARMPADRPLRILEIGAGTGGTTSAVLGCVPPERTEYWFTDTSAFFLSRAEEKFHAFPFVHYQRVDVESALDAQGIAGGSFDVVIAADVLHALHDVRGAIERCRTALVDGGLLIVRELTQPRIALDLVFGMTEGWWNYRHDALRPHGPLLGTLEWSRVLEAEGFERPAIPGACERTGPGTVLVARALPRPSRDKTNPPLVPGDAAPPERDWLVFGDRDDHTRELVSRLRASGLRCIDAHAGERFQRHGPDSCSLNLERLEDRQQLAALCEQEFAASYAAVYVQSFDVADIDEAPAAGCARIVGLIQALAASAVKPPRRLMVAMNASATRHAAANTGLMRVAANEFAAVAIRMVTLDPADPRRFDRLYAEIVADGVDEEVAWRGAHRFVPRLEPVPEAGRRTSATRTQTAFEIVTGRAGDLDRLELRETRARRPRRDEVEVDVHFAALNFRDVLKALGRFPSENPRGLELGDECSGIVKKVGAGVHHVKAGDRVVACHVGAFRSDLTVPAHAVLPIADNLELDAAVSMPVAFLTADYALREIGRLSQGETVLIHAAAGGVGLAAVQIALRAGARVLATAGSPAKRELLKRLGIECVMDSRSLTFFDDVMDATEGRGVDVVLNSLAGTAMTRSLACLAPRGRFLELGKRDFYENTHVGLWPLRRNASYHAIDLSAFLAKASIGPGSLREVFANAASGDLRPLPIRVLPANRAPEAFRLMAQGAHIGKVVLNMKECGTHVKCDARRVALKPSATYLVTGAFGGTGLSVARWLAERGARHLALVSRHGPQSASARDAVDELVAAGCDVRVMTCDVTNRQDVTCVVGAIDRGMPPLAGVFHLATMIDDGLIVNLDADRLARSMAPKLDGAWNLHCLTRDRKLDHFVMFSSASATIGNFGQASYAAANAALEQLAADRRAHGLPATAIAWGVLGDAGYVAERPALAASLAQLGLAPLSTQDMCDALDIAMTSGEPVLVVARIDWQQVWRRFGGQVARANLLSTLFSRAGTSTASQRAARAGEAIKAAAPADRPELVAQYVRSTVARVLGMSESKISADRPLAEMGLDSLMGVELASQVEAELGVSFPLSALGHDITITRIADMISRDLGGVPRPTAAPAPQNVDASPDSCVVQLSGPANGRPLFCFHPAGGELNVYKSVAKALGSACRVLGIQSRMIAGAQDEFTSLEDMAAAYADLVRHYDPHGPYQLFGFSFGGLVALHTARILRDRGGAVAWIGLAETYLRSSADQYAEALTAFLLELYEHMRSELRVVKDVPVETLQNGLADLAKRLVAAPVLSQGANGNGADSSLLMQWFAGGYLREETPLGLVEQYLARIAAHVRLLARDQACPTIDVPLHVWQADEPLISHCESWNTVTTRPVQVRTLTAGHFDMMAPPHSQVIASELAGLIGSRTLQ